MVHLREIPPSGLADGVLVIAALPTKAEAELTFLGPKLPDSMAKSIAEGTYQTQSFHTSMSVLIAEIHCLLQCGTLHIVGITCVKLRYTAILRLQVWPVQCLLPGLIILII